MNAIIENGNSGIMLKAPSQFKAPKLAAKKEVSAQIKAEKKTGTAEPGKVEEVKEKKRAKSHTKKKTEEKIIKD